MAGITGGGGAAQVTVDVINAMWDNAQDKTDDGDARVSQAIALAGAAPKLAPVTIDGNYKPPGPPGLPSDDPNNGEAIYAAQRDFLIQLITTSFRNFITEFFPNQTYYQHALDWCDRAITQGGSGIKPEVEQALWQRGRARILGDSARAAAEAEQTWANRRFPLPPGALTNQLNEINLDAGRKLAEVNRDIAVKMFDTEIENVRFAVKTVIDQRKVALDAAGDYIKTLMLGPQTAADLAAKLVSIRSELARNLVALYSAQVQAAEPGVRLAIADAQIRLEGEKANVDAQLRTVDSKVRAALTGAQMVGSMASAGINAVSGRAQISGSDSSQV